MCAYNIALNSVRQGLVCFHLGTDGGMAAFLSMMGLFRGETAKNPEMRHSCSAGVTQNSDRSQAGSGANIASPDSQAVT